MLFLRYKTKIKGEHMERVIVYRSQTEAEFDKLLWSGNGVIFEIMVFMVAYVGSVVLLSKLCEKFVSWKHRNYIVFLGTIPLSYVIYKIILKLII